MTSPFLRRFLRLAGTLSLAFFLAAMAVTLLATVIQVAGLTVRVARIEDGR